MAKVKSLTLARQMDISPAREDWGFKPEFDLDKSMQDYVKQCTENRELLNYEIPEF